MHVSDGTHSCGFAGVLLETGPGGPDCSSLTPCPRSSLTPSAVGYGEQHTSELCETKPEDLNPQRHDQRAASRALSPRQASKAQLCFITGI